MLELTEVFALIKQRANEAGTHPGIYKMINDKGIIIYVGKAKHLKNRLMSYTKFEDKPQRLKLMISNIYQIEFIIVKSEIEALLLENNLIKQHKPFFNILLKDNKTFPYICIDKSSDFPRILKYRTLNAKNKNLYGPYPLGGAVDETIKVIQKIFQIRTCSNNNFANRNRPCIQYFIKQCSAPCCHKISKDEYAQNIQFTEDLLNGKSEIAYQYLRTRMNKAAQELNFEQAASFRDAINAISTIISKQYIQIKNFANIDFIAAALGEKQSIIAITFFRAGTNVGTETFGIQNSCEEDQEADIIESFIMQYYKNAKLPEIIISSQILPNAQKLEEFFHQEYQETVKIQGTKNDIFQQILQSTALNANIKLSNNTNISQFDPIKELKILTNTELIRRIEIYDNSHIQGTNACGVMVVCEDGKIQKSKARKFNIPDDIANGGDDFAMMQYTMQRRFTSQHLTTFPDLLIIDGGQIQMSAVKFVLNDLGINNIKMIGIAKQNHRTEGDEKIIFEDGSEKALGRHSELLKFLIKLRNEAHNTAINFHRKKRNNAIRLSILDSIPGIGRAKKQKLLQHFGSVEAIGQASLAELASISGINQRLAANIHSFFEKEAK